MKHNRTPPAPRGQRNAKGVIGTVRCRTTIPGHTTLSILNDVGGTTSLPVGRYRVRLLLGWLDDETGARCIGALLDPVDIATARSVGTTGFRPDDERRYGRERDARTRQAAAEFNPARVFFALDDFTPDPHGDAA